MGHLRRFSLQGRRGAEPLLDSVRRTRTRPELLGEPHSVLEIGCGTGRALAGPLSAASTLEVTTCLPSWRRRPPRSGRAPARSSCAPSTGVPERARGVVRRGLLDLRCRLVRRPGPSLPPLSAGGSGPIASSSLAAAGHPRRVGPQGLYKGSFAGRPTFTYRYSHRWAVGERLLTRAGFATADARVLNAPHAGHIGTLLVRAVAPWRTRSVPCRRGGAGRRAPCRTDRATHGVSGYCSPSLVACWATSVSERRAPVNRVGRKERRRSCSWPVVISVAARRPRIGARVIPLCETRQ